MTASNHIVYTLFPFGFIFDYVRGEKIVLRRNTGPFAAG